MEAILMNKNTETIKVDVNLITTENGFPTLKFNSATYINKDLCPPCIFAEDNEKDIFLGQITYWFKKRLISEKREDLNLKKPITWSGNPNFFSLTDQYWFKYSEEETWDALNYFNNPYSSLIGEVAFSKNLDNIKEIIMDYGCPDLTTNGVLKKKWIKIGTRNVLVKHMSKEFQQEPLSEILATKLLSKLKIINFVSYYLYIEGYDLCSRCNDFVTSNTEFVPASYLYSTIPYSDKDKEIPEKERIYKHLMLAIDKYKIPDAKEFIDTMIIVDRLMLNFDRHLGNFGFIRNVETGEYIGPAPLFDFGGAFFGDIVDYKSKLFEDREKYLFKNQKIQPLSDKLLNELKDEISKISLLSDKKKISIINNLCENNKLIKKEIQKSQDYYKDDKENEDKEYIQTANVDF